MQETLIRWSIITFSGAVLGPTAGWLVSTLHLSDGSDAATLLVNSSSVMGLLAGLGVMALTTIAALIAAKLADSATGFLCAGLVLGWAAWRSGDMETMLLITRNPAIFWTLALEGAMLIAFGIALCAAICTLGNRNLHADQDGLESNKPLSREIGSLIFNAVSSTGGLLGNAAAFIAAAVGVWIVAWSSLKGQTVWAVIAGAMLAGAASRVVDPRIPTVSIFRTILLLAVLGPIAGALLVGADAVQAAHRGTITALALPMPLDWLAGAFLGIPIGLGWASSMTDKVEHEIDPKPPHAAEPPQSTSHQAG